MPRARNSDQIALTRDLRQRLAAQTEPPDANGCMRFYPEDNGTQIYAEIYGQRGLQIVSVRRVAWAFAHEHEVGFDEHGRPRGCLMPNEEVVTLCGTVGDDNTARGQCVNPDHLGRGTEEQRVQLRTARQTIIKVKEATR